MKSTLAAVASVIGVVAAGAGAYFAYQQLEIDRDTKASKQPDIVLCVDEFSYSKGKPRHGIANNPTRHANVTSKVRLVNRGGTPATVTRIDFKAVGKNSAGERKTMSFGSLVTSQSVAANSVSRARTFEFTTDSAILPKSWVESPEEFQARVYWAGGHGKLVTCRPPDWGATRCTIGRKSVPSC